MNQEEETPAIWLKRHFQERQNVNPMYSLRAFARALNINSGRLSQYLNSKRSISHETGMKICAKINCDLKEKKKFLDLIETENRKRKKFKDFYKLNNVAVPKKLIKDHEFECIADPLHYMLLSLCLTKGFRNDIEWMAYRLRTNKSKILKAIQNLLDANLLERGELGQLKVSSPGSTRTTTDIPSEALKVYHRNQIENAFKAIEEQEVDERDISSIVLAIDKSKLPQAKKLIQDFRYRMSHFLESGGQDEVYTLNIQLFANSFQGENVNDD